ncbi:peptidoglycan DD-metalloendopeptidase family protein [Aestuariivirga sp.]|uniref:peptidoglycan DD-metalloendopeptidase family protein n=1 Tax=Aestuariivirga sp. TaxID=2650926 RepID=UPI0039E3E49C
MSSSLPRAVRGMKAHYIVTAFAAVMLAGCSSSVERFASSGGSSNPSDADPVYTASVPKQQVASSDDDVVTSKPLGGSNYRTTTGYNYGSNAKKPIYKQPVQQASTQSFDDGAPVAGGGNTVTVGQGMTLYSIARSHNLTVAELAAANHLKAPYAVHQGMVLNVPEGRIAMAAPTPVKLQKTASAEVETQPKQHIAGGATHQVASGETLYSLGRKFGVKPQTIADANGLNHNATLRVGQTVKIPGSNAARVATGAPPTTLKVPSKTAAVADDDAPSTEQPAPAKIATAAPTAIPDAKSTTAADTAAATPDTTAPTPSLADAGAPGMRWPVRGKVISGFGGKPNGLKNEGINIAVPEGTSIRAADDGVVAYAGNELKGYGNLVLIRHQDGYVTAYAHAKELFVKRGDTVKRGDVIAKAGQTGSVSSPQLHFEVRKGATALDPMQFLGSSTAANG